MLAARIASRSFSAPYSTLGDAPAGSTTVAARDTNAQRQARTIDMSDLLAIDSLAFPRNRDAVHRATDADRHVRPARQRDRRQSFGVIAVSAIHGNGDGLIDRRDRHVPSVENFDIEPHAGSKSG